MWDQEMVEKISNKLIYNQDLNSKYTLLFFEGQVNTHLIIF